MTELLTPDATNDKSGQSFLSLQSSEQESGSLLATSNEDTLPDSEPIDDYFSKEPELDHSEELYFDASAAPQTMATSPPPKVATPSTPPTTMESPPPPSYSSAVGGGGGGKPVFLTPTAAGSLRSPPAQGQIRPPAAPADQGLLEKYGVKLPTAGAFATSIAVGTVQKYIIDEIVYNRVFPKGDGVTAPPPGPGTAPGTGVPPTDGVAPPGPVTLRNLCKL